MFWEDRDAADVPPVSENEQGQERDQRVLRRVQAPGRVERRAGEIVDEGGGNGDPEADGFQRQCVRGFQRLHANHCPRPLMASDKARHMLCHSDLADAQATSS
jgi:hypothetical protein